MLASVAARFSTHTDGVSESRDEYYGLARQRLLSARVICNLTTAMLLVFCAGPALGFDNCNFIFQSPARALVGTQFSVSGSITTSADPNTNTDTTAVFSASIKVVGDDSNDFGNIDAVSGINGPYNFTAHFNPELDPKSANLVSFNCDGLMMSIAHTNTGGGYYRLEAVVP